MSEAGPVQGAGIRYVLGLLFASGWAANHFASMIPVLGARVGLSARALDAAFGLYAVGLLPSLLVGGGASDRLGRRPVVLVGAAVAALGNLAMAVQASETTIYAGRLVVGLGVGLAVSAGTAWAADLGGKAGTTLAGMLLTGGFAAGPLATGLLAQWLPGPAVVLPFVVTAALTAVVVALAAARGPHSVAARVHTAHVTGSDDRRVGVALFAAVPMALWVFGSATVSFVTLAARMQARLHGPWVPGAAAALTLGAGILVQVAGRRAGWGPRAGVVGAALVAVGYVLVALAGAQPPVPLFVVCAVVLGCGYGMCLREGLTDIELLSPPERRGVAIGVFYVFAYVGFGFPLLLRVLEPAAGTVTPLLVLAALATLSALVRGGTLRATSHLDRR